MYVGGQTSNYTKFIFSSIYFPIHPNLQRNFFVGGGEGWGMVGRHLNSATYLQIILGGNSLILNLLILDEVT